MKTALGECTQSVVYLDARRLEEEGYTRQVLYELFSEEFSGAGGLWFKAKDYLKRVKGVHVGPVGVDIDWGEGGTRLSSLFRALDEWASDQGKILVVAVDGAQVLRRLAGGKSRINFVQLIAYSYDNLENIRFILTGSEAGLLHEFLGLEDPESALYARGYNTITLERFNRETSLGFLEAGFRELGVKPPKGLLSSAVDRLDGLVGWLTLFKYTATERGAEAALEEVLRKAKGIVKKEMVTVLRRSNHYRPILKALSQGKNGWSQLKKEPIN
ncbi:hypothetical protein B9Q04_11755 [Candidatus Marsarchaeota G2 archaeon BE_D]|uniref:ATPase domain-containing protein n=1 Tax=Candidatus Marsarchaeota G2 archaeon BE_D TaxID=1978158 RepID=A0A2R6C936_9ARCH|nr:MAG: hypothetical protein B9Q04_11755 [Candidatus Marsarchaeota G2 archaeon BE_D]